jgi:hypothetical protein
MGNLKRRKLLRMMNDWVCEFTDLNGLKSTFDIQVGTTHEQIWDGKKIPFEDNFKVEQAFDRSIDEEGKTLIKKSFRHYYHTYEINLENCFKEFKEEIEDNMLNSNQITKQEYISDIYKDLIKLRIDDGNYLEHLEVNKPQINKLPDDFIEYLKNKNIDIKTLHEIEIGEQCKLFLKIRNYDILERLESEVSKFSSYYSYKGINEININTSEINNEQISKFINEYLYIKYMPYLKNFVENDETKQSKITFNHSLNDSHFDAILTLVNSINIFSKTLSIDELKSIFNCTHSSHFVVLSNQDIAYLFNCLQQNKFISSEWQSIIEKNRLFKGRKIQNTDRCMTAKNLSKSLNEADPNKSNSKLIISTIEKMK